jgi:hypothetical protein
MFELKVRNRMITWKDIEAQAIKFSEDPKNLRKRLLWTLEWLGIENRKNWKTDAANKRLLSPCGCWAVQWKTRPNPNLPESYNNQQTSEGSGELIQISKEKD